MIDYHIDVFYSKTNGGYIADVPDLKYCSAFGEIPEEAVREVQLAKSTWLDAARDSGKSIPRPRYRPAIHQSSRNLSIVPQSINWCLDLWRLERLQCLAG